MTGGEYLIINNITKTFGQAMALDNLCFSVNKNEFVCLLGPSGCGKTTLLRLIAGLEEPNAGSVVLNGRDITRLPPARRNFGIVFQSYALFPNITAYDNVAYGLKTRKLSPAEINARVNEVLALVGLEQAGYKYPAQLSGGQQQRIALARALALAPAVLLLDEPLSALDAKVRVKLRHEIRSLQEKTGITTIMVTHDQEEALTMADRIVVMNNACVEQIGTPQAVYDHPRTPFVADFIGAINFVDPGHCRSLSPEEPEMVAIRPEYVKIVEAGSAPGGVTATVTQVEFRGAFYRVTLKIAGGKDSLIADIAAATGVRLEKNKTVCLELPDDRLLRYRRNSYGPDGRIASAG